MKKTLKKVFFRAIFIALLLLFITGVSLENLVGAILVLTSLGGFYLLGKNQEIISFLESLSKGCDE